MKFLIRHSSVRSLLSRLEMEFSCFPHALEKAQLHTDVVDIKSAIFITEHAPHDTALLPRCSNGSYLHPGFLLGHRRSVHGSVRPPDCLETTHVVPISAEDRCSQDVGKLCRVLANEPRASVESCLDRSGVMVSPALVEEVLKKLSNGGTVALTFFRWAEKQQGFKLTTEIFHGLIEALGKIKQFRLVWNIVEAMKIKGLLTKETFVLVVRRYARARKIKEAIETLDKMGRFGLEPDISDFNKLIDTISKSRYVKRAQEVFDEMKRKRRFSPDLKTYTILMEGWGNEQNLSRLNEIYQEMKDDGFEPDVVAYAILINAHCKAGKLDEAIEIYNEMEMKNISPTPHIYCTMINGLGSNDRLSDALKFFKLSKASGILPELPTYNAVVGSYCSASRFNDAYSVLDQMMIHGLRPNSRTYDIIIHHLMKAGRRKEAYSLFQRMDSEFGCEPGLNTYTVIVAMLCAHEQVDEALKVWKKMNEKGVLPCMHMFSSLINGLCAEGRLDEACSYFQQMIDKGIRPPGQLYGNLKQALMEAGLRDLAINMGRKLDELRETPLDG